MSDEKTQILIRALEASGSEREAKLARAILGETPAAPAEAPPAAPEISAPVAAAQQGPPPPPGKAPLRTLDEWESLPQEERMARMDEADALLLEGQS